MPIVETLKNFNKQPDLGGVTPTNEDSAAHTCKEFKIKERMNQFEKDFEIKVTKIGEELSKHLNRQISHQCKQPRKSKQKAFWDK